MSSKSTASTAAQADEGCPECGGPVYYEPMCTSGTADQVTSGTACGLQLVRTRRAINAGRSRRGRDPRGAIDLGNKGETRTSHPNYDADRNVYVDPGGCPECSADLEICLIGNRQAAYSIQPEFRAMAEICTEYGDGDDECSHRAPDRQQPLFSAAKIHRTRSRPFSTTPQADSSCAVTGCCPPEFVAPDG